MMSESDFLFIDPTPLEDGELSLIIEKTTPAIPEKNYVPAYYFQMIVEGKDAGWVNFRAQTTPLLEKIGGHLGYEVHEEYRGHHFAERACRLLFPLAKHHGFKHLIITCNPDNTPSRRTCERLGATLMGVEKIPKNHELYAKGEREKCRYKIEMD